MIRIIQSSRFKHPPLDIRFISHELRHTNLAFLSCKTRYRCRLVVFNFKLRSPPIYLYFFLFFYLFLLNVHWFLVIKIWRLYPKITHGIKPTLIWSQVVSQLHFSKEIFVGGIISIKPTAGSQELDVSDFKKPSFIKVFQVFHEFLTLSVHQNLSSIIIHKFGSF